MRESAGRRPSLRKSAGLGWRCLTVVNARCAQIIEEIEPYFLLRTLVPLLLLRLQALRTLDSNASKRCNLGPAFGEGRPWNRKFQKSLIVRSSWLCGSFPKSKQCPGMALRPDADAGTQVTWGLHHTYAHIYRDRERERERERARRERKTRTLCSLHIKAVTKPISPLPTPT